MDWLVLKSREADLLVFASPLYVDGVSGPMKTLIDRLIPLIRMNFEIRDNHCRHVSRDSTIRKNVLVSNCGFWEKDNFNPLIFHMQAIARNINAEIISALVRPHGAFMKKAAETGFPCKDILDASRHAGHQVVETGYIKNKTLEAVSRDLLTREQFMELIGPAVAQLIERIGYEDQL